MSERFVPDSWKGPLPTLTEEAQLAPKKRRKNRFAAPPPPPGHPYRDAPVDDWLRSRLNSD